MPHASREVQDLMKRCARLGWEVSETTAGHYRVKPPEGEVLHFGNDTSGDPRTLKNIRADLRRAGFDAAEDGYNRTRSHRTGDKMKPTNGTNDTTSTPVGTVSSIGDVPPGVDQHTLGIIRFGRMVGRLAQAVDPKQLDAIASIIEMADALGLTLAEAKVAILDAGSEHKDAKR